MNPNDPELLGQVRIAVALLVAALLITTVAVYFDSRRQTENRA